MTRSEQMLKVMKEELEAGRLSQADFDTWLGSPARLMWDTISDEEMDARQKTRNSEYESYKNLCRIRSDLADGLVYNEGSAASIPEDIEKVVLTLNCLDSLSQSRVPSSDIIAHTVELIATYETRAKMFHNMSERTGEAAITLKMFKVANEYLLTAQYMRKMLAIRQAQGRWPK